MWSLLTCACLTLSDIREKSFHVLSPIVARTSASESIRVVRFLELKDSITQRVLRQIVRTLPVKLRNGG